MNQIGINLGRPVGLKLTKAGHPKLRTLPIAQKLAALTVFYPGRAGAGQNCAGD